MARGNRKATIFTDDADCIEFLQLLERVAERLDWRLWAFCLMPNHYHLLVETSSPTLQRGMQYLNGSYAQYFNRRRELVGHVFQGRYKALLVDKETYALQVVRYIVRNPVRAGLCASLADWRWSSHRATLGDAVPPSFLAPARVLHFFGTARTSRTHYDKFVSLSAFDEEALVSPGPNRAVLGDDAFVRTLAVDTPVDQLEHARPDRVFKTLSRYQREHLSRNAAIRAAYAGGAFSQAAIARHFGLHYSTVSKVVRNARRRRSSSDPKRQDSRSDPT